MQKKGFVIGIDLGTSTATASFCRILDYRDSKGKLRREKAGKVYDVTDWPASVGSAIGSPCVPTDLIYSKALKKLLRWGFEAQEYLDSAFPDIPREEVFVVENIKLLLPDPSTETNPSTASERYRLKRELLKNTLSKEPADVFEDFMTQLLSHVIGSLNEKHYNGINCHLIELVIAFPSGWHDSIHTKVARISTRAMKKAIAGYNPESVVFGLEHVYTVSETICGIKEWLRETVSDLSATEGLVPQPTNLDELQVGDCFLPFDIGAGTGCMTPLKLISKLPLAVEQLDTTQSLEVCGEVVEAEFERWLRPQITKTYYPGDIPRLVNRICRMFKEEKKKCGLQSGQGSSSTWTFEVNRLRAHPKREWEKNCMRLRRQELNTLFDPMISILEEEISKTLAKFPSIKAIIFLGQFGGNSVYLKKKIANSQITKAVKIRYSQSGKMDVVKGAISERLTLDECFVRQYKTSKSYGTLVTLVYNDITRKLFPKPQQHGAVPFENSEDGLRLKVIEWAIPKGTVIHNGQSHNIGKDGTRHHTWPFNERDIGFEDTIIISDESISAAQLFQTPYSLWTTDHEQDKLFIDGRRVRVQQIPFGWDLSMSQKVDSSGNMLGPYHEENLGCLPDSPFESKTRRRSDRLKQRVLHYNLIWDITEMQVKLHVQALIPDSEGPLMTQLAKERLLDQDEKEVATESRSMALDKDIMLTHVPSGLGAEPQESNRNEDVADQQGGAVDDKPGDSISQQTANAPIVDLTLHETEGLRLSLETVGQQYSVHNDMRSPQQNVFPILESQSTAATTNQYQSHGHVQEIHSAAGSQQQQQVDDRPVIDNVNQYSAVETSCRPVNTGPVTGSVTDRRRRSGCYTCKDRKKKCDSIYIHDYIAQATKCTTCMKHDIFCHLEKPLEWVEDPMQRQAEQLQRKEQVKLGKRKSRERSDSLSQSVRGRSTTLASQEGSSSQPTLYPSIEPPWQHHNVNDPLANPVQRGSFTAIRGRRGSSKTGRPNIRGK